MIDKKNHRFIMVDYKANQSKRPLSVGYDDTCTIKFEPLVWG